jgi:hypothetical protein
MSETVVINEKPAGDDPEHIAKMVALADGAESQAADSRPEWLPEKFKSAEEMANAYKSLESKLGVKEPEAPVDPVDPVVTPDPVDPNAAVPDDAALASELSSKGLDLSKFVASYEANGEINQAEYDELIAGGYPRDTVDQFIEGRVAKRQIDLQNIKSVVGGDAEFASMSAWASANASNESLTSYNKAMESKDQSLIKLALQGMHAQYKDSRGSEPKLLTGANGTTASDLYESVQQMTTDMKNPAYKTDPAFRRKVEAKISRSSIF